MKLVLRTEFVWLGIIVLALSQAGCASRGGGNSGSAKEQPTTRAQAIAKAHTELAAQYYERGQAGVALEEVGIALNADPKYAPAYNVRGLVRMTLREYQQADEDFRYSLQLDANDSDTHNNYGWYLCQQGRESESMEHFMAALKNPLYSTPAKAYLNAGLCARKNGKNREAEDFFQKALAVQFDMPEALFGLADLALASGDYAGAKSYFLRFSRTTPSLTAENLWLAVRIERKLGDRNAESNYAMQLRQRFPEARETQLMLYGQ